MFLSQSSSKIIWHIWFLPLYLKSYAAILGLTVQNGIRVERAIVRMSALLYTEINYLKDTG